MSDVVFFYRNDCDSEDNSPSKAPPFDNGEQLYGLADRPKPPDAESLAAFSNWVGWKKGEMSNVVHFDGNDCDL